jgi:putative DNA primase/helicase
VKTPRVVGAGSGDQNQQMTVCLALEVDCPRNHHDRAHGGNGGDGTNGILLPSPSEPMAVARIFADECLHNGTPTLRHWRGAWWMWQTSHWVEADDRALRSILYRFTEHAFYVQGKMPKPWAPTRRKIIDLADALSAICFLQNDIDQPNWLDATGQDGVIVSFANGLLDVERRRLIPHTPLFFNQTSVPFNFDPKALEPDCWLKFIGELWPNEPDAIKVLGEWFGYVISGRTDLHKILLMVGPTRGGKGVIARVLSALVGRKNVAGPTLNSLGGEFGLTPLIGKPLAIISDARFAGKDASVVVERLLSISGEDTLTVNRKYRDQWTGKLPSRLHVLSNELPKLGDASTAIVGRIVLLLLSHSWLGREDHGLETTLHAQLSGILNWALDGLHRLAINNNFTRIPSADEAVVAMRDLASPIAAFVRDRCEIGPDKEVSVDALYNVYRSWAEDNGHAKKSKHTFGRDLRAAVPSVSVVRPRDKDDKEARPRVYAGIDLIKPENF